ncbi:unnamed protein product [Rotaria sordida]|uniref:J domain-containing protein n=1 Tax=Rotaria sordida TaxID=392033 RepID=A0A818UU53_9BILA|nr:unnamed protein product [Rotaria sordida]
MYSIKYIIIYFILGFHNLSANQNDFNPYEILGLSRTASDKEIRQSYKRLAKYWHPDKNSESNAHDQFTKINAAYEILSDSKKRQQYDEYGTTSDDNHHGFNTYHFRDPFDMFRAHFFHETSSSAKKTIHSHEFLNNILPNSDKKPYLIFGSTNFCFHCRKPLEIFRSIEKQFNDVGIGTAEFNINDERLSSQLGILNIPSLCVISQGRVYHFDMDYTEANIKEFVRKSIPIKRFIQILRNYDDILTMIKSYNQSNRVHALLITKQKIPTLKFVIPCLQYSTRIQCALFNSSLIKTTSIPSFLKQISIISDTVLLFKEDINKPEFVIKDNDFTFDNLQKLFESNQLLHLSTITSANVFNLICQINSAKPCFLIIGDRNLFAQYHLSFLQLSKQLFDEYKSRMAYLDSSSVQQVQFHEIVSSYYHTNEKKLLILVARRLFSDTIEIQNTNIEFDEKSLNEIQRNIIHIEENLKLFINNRWQFTKKYKLPIIINFDERKQDIFTRIIDQFEYKWNYWIERNRLLRYLSGYLYTYQFWMFTILIFVYMYYSRSESDNRNHNLKQSSKINQIKICEFNEALLQQYTNPGASNVIILVLIADTPEDLCVKDFIREINLIKDSHMIFSILYRQQSMKWLNELSKKIQNQQSIKFFSSNVLALYIRRKFFVSYESISNNNEQSNQTLTFLDWIDLLFNGNFREPITITEWPMKFN